MEIISYRPSDDQFWIGCSKAEAEKFFLPLLDQCGLDHYNMIMRDKIGRDKDYCGMGIALSGNVSSKGLSLWMS